MADAARGNRASLARLYELYYDRVRQLCRYLLGSRLDADDAAAEIFVRLRRLAEAYDGRVPFANYLLRAASHYCIDQIRRRRLEARIFAKEQPEEFRAPSRDSSALTMLIAEERRQELEAAIERLPPAYRVPLVLRYYRDLSYDEIAAELGITRTQVGLALFRAKHALRRTLQKGAS